IECPALGEVAVERPELAVGGAEVDRTIGPDREAREGPGLCVVSPFEEPARLYEVDQATVVGRQIAVAVRSDQRSGAERQGRCADIGRPAPAAVGPEREGR